MQMFLKFVCSFINLHCIKTVFTTWANYRSSKRNIASLYPLRSTVKKKKKSLFSWFCNPNRKWDEKIFPKCNYFIVNTYFLELEEVSNDTNIVHLATCKCALVSQLMHVLTLCLCLSLLHYEIQQKVFRAVWMRSSYHMIDWTKWYCLLWEGKSNPHHHEMSNFKTKYFWYIVTW